MNVTTPKTKLCISDIECIGWILSVWLKHTILHFCICKNTSRPKLQANQLETMLTLIFLVKDLSECQRR